MKNHNKKIISLNDDRLAYFADQIKEKLLENEELFINFQNLEINIEKTVFNLSKCGNLLIENSEKTAFNFFNDCPDFILNDYIDSRISERIFIYTNYLRLAKYTIDSFGYGNFFTKRYHKFVKHPTEKTIIEQLFKMSFLQNLDFIKEFASNIQVEDKDILINEFYAIDQILCDVLLKRGVCVKIINNGPTGIASLRLFKEYLKNIDFDKFPDKLINSNIRSKKSINKLIDNEIKDLINKHDLSIEWKFDDKIDNQLDHHGHNIEENQEIVVLGDNELEG